MKAIIIIGLLATLLVLAACSMSPTGDVVLEEQQVIPPTPKAESSARVVDYTLFVNDDAFSPVFLQAKKGDVVSITVASQVDHDHPLRKGPFDIVIPDLGVTEVVNIGDTFDFKATESGDHEFMCITCSPELSGTLYVE